MDSFEIFSSLKKKKKKAVIIVNFYFSLWSQAFFLFFFPLLKNNFSATVSFKRGHQNIVSWEPQYFDKNRSEGCPAARALTGLRPHHLGSDLAMLCISSIKLPRRCTSAVFCPVPCPCEDLLSGRWWRLDYWSLTCLSKSFCEEQDKWGKGEERN